MRHYFEIKNYYNQLVRDILLKISLTKTYQEAAESTPEQKKTRESLEETDGRISTVVREMIMLFNPSLAKLDDLIDRISWQAYHMINEHVQPFIDGKKDKSLLASRVDTNDYEKKYGPVAEALIQQKREGKYQNESQLSAGKSLKLNVISLVANICHFIAKSIRRIKGQERFADELEEALDKAAKEAARRSSQGAEAKLVQAREQNGLRKKPVQKFTTGSDGQLIFP